MPKLTEAQRLERQERLGQKTFRGLLARINMLLKENSLTVEQRLELIHLADRFTKQLKRPGETRGRPKKQVSGTFA